MSTTASSAAGVPATSATATSATAASAPAASAPAPTKPTPDSSSKGTPRATATLASTATGLYGILAGGFVAVLTLVVLFTTGSLFAVLVLWMMVVAIVSVLVYYGMVDLEKILDDLFPSPKKPSAAPSLSPFQFPSGSPLVGSEVFHVSDPNFTYDQAEAVCAAYDSQLASLEQIIDAYNHGAEWCSYGWSRGGMALYPTQKTTWEQLQNEPDTGRRTRCGRPGVNGGYFDPSTKFGVNCFGFKPKGEFKPPAPVPGSDPQAFRDMVNKFKDMIKGLNLSPYSRKEWSGYDSGSVSSYGAQFTQNLGKLTEGFDVGDPNYVEAVPASGVSRTASPLAPFGLRGEKGEKGEKGDKGDTGPPGPPGASAVAIPPPTLPTAPAIPPPTVPSAPAPPPPPPAASSSAFGASQLPTASNPCGTLGTRQTVGGTQLRVYTRTECDALGGLFAANGECSKPTGGSFSWDCRNL